MFLVIINCVYLCFHFFCLNDHGEMNYGTELDKLIFFHKLAVELFLHNPICITLMEGFFCWNYFCLSYVMLVFGFLILIMLYCSSEN